MIKEGDNRRWKKEKWRNCNDYSFVLFILVYVVVIKKGRKEGMKEGRYMSNDEERKERRV